jgi:hypothetical protein
MSKQLRYFVVKEDIDQFLQFAEQNGFRRVPEVIESETIPVAQRPTDVDVQPSSHFFYLLPHQFAAAEAFYKELPYEAGFSKLIARTSPVIEVSPVEVANDKPKEGRIYICQDSSDPRFNMAMKAYELLAGFLKNWPKSSDGRYHIGPKAAPLMRDRQERPA